MPLGTMLHNKIWLYSCSSISMDIQTWIGISASICTAMSLIPQLIKVLKEKQAEDVSLWMLVVLFAGLGLWVYYGILKKDLIIIISNSFSFTINLLLTIFAVKYKR
ncbi:MAG TPA: SemiSWEET transporter [Ferruginibacter sp.]|jgi:MtN3 and saliva related transmembrane protein|nr:SemiSWEET transporter [Ferruginibacter sp.]